MNAHPAADLFPMMSDQELAELATDIRAHGLLEPIVLLDGLVLDGRNRHRACELAGVEARTVEWDGSGDPAVWVISKNLRRRHLSTSQRAMVAGKLIGYYAAAAKERQREHGGTAPGKASLSANLHEVIESQPSTSQRAMGAAKMLEDRGRATEHAARDLSVSPRTVEHAATVIERGVPELVAAVERGAVAVSTAAEAAALPAPKQDALVAAVAAAATPAAARQIVRAILKEERDEKRAVVNERRVVDLEQRTARLSTPPGVDLRCADVRDVLASLVPGSVGLTHADPPWSYRNEGVNGAADGHYQTGSVSGIVATLDAAFDAAADDTYLLLWATFPLLAEWFAAHTGMRWRYLSGGAWGKLGRPGSGFHWRGDAELLLLYAKGSPKPGHDVMSNLHTSERTAHSEKPAPYLKRCVEHFVAPGVVLDLWAGMAPLGRACAALGRPYVGAEIDAERHRHAIALLREASLRASAP